MNAGRQERPSAPFVCPAEQNGRKVRKERARAPDSVLRVVWGGAFNFDDSSTRCATRFGFDASEGYWDAGF
jgi:hypothetical protein